MIINLNELRKNTLYALTLQEDKLDTFIYNVISCLKDKILNIEDITLKQRREESSLLIYIQSLKNKNYVKHICVIFIDSDNILYYSYDNMYTDFNGNNKFSCFESINDISCISNNWKVLEVHEKCIIVALLITLILHCNILPNQKFKNKTKVWDKFSNITIL
jgi:hypothetical protein